MIGRQGESHRCSLEPSHKIRRSSSINIYVNLNSIYHDHVSHSLMPVQIKPSWRIYAVPNLTPPRNNSLRTIQQKKMWYHVVYIEDMIGKNRTTLILRDLCLCLHFPWRNRVQVMLYCQRYRAWTCSQRRDNHGPVLVRLFTSLSACTHR